MINKYIIIIVIILLSISGCINYTRKIQINNADNQTKQIIQEALNSTDKNAVKYINSITITTSEQVSQICHKINEDLGCNDLKYDENNNLVSSDIYIVRDPDQYKGLCNTFENTLYHEIGHTVYAYKFGYNEINPEENAKEYASNYARNKCDNT